MFSNPLVDGLIERLLDVVKGKLWPIVEDNARRAVHGFMKETHARIDRAEDRLTAAERQQRELTAKLEDLGRTVEAQQARIPDVSGMHNRLHTLWVWNIALTLAVFALLLVLLLRR